MSQGRKPQQKATTKKAKKARSAKILRPDLWRTFIASDRSNTEVRNQLIELEASKVTRLAKRMTYRSPGGIDADDLVQAGYIGLVDAANRFDPSRGYTFWSYASRRCLGAMVDSLRSWSFVPRAVLSKNKDRMAIEQDLQNSSGRLTSTEEVERDLNWSRSDRLASQATQIKSLDGMIWQSQRGDMHLADILAAAESASETDAEFGRFLEDILKAEPLRIKVIAWLYFAADLSMREIGLIVGRSESRVSQTLAEALENVRAILLREANQAAKENGRLANDGADLTTE
ncbi:MAG: sigma-70 family RNA polymerase sigma factor [Pseudomonadota bacterium]